MSALRKGGWVQQLYGTSSQGCRGDGSIVKADTCSQGCENKKVCSDLDAPHFICRTAEIDASGAVCVRKQLRNVLAALGAYALALRRTWRRQFGEHGLLLTAVWQRGIRSVKHLIMLAHSWDMNLSSSCSCLAAFSGRAVLVTGLQVAATPERKQLRRCLLLFLRVRGDRKPSWSYSVARDGKHGRGKA